MGLVRSCVEVRLSLLLSITPAWLPYPRSLPVAPFPVSSRKKGKGHTYPGSCSPLPWTPREPLATASYNGGCEVLSSFGSLCALLKPRGFVALEEGRMVARGQLMVCHSSSCCGGPLRATKTETLNTHIPIYSIETEYIILMCSNLLRHKRSEENESFTISWII